VVPEFDKAIAEVKERLHRNGLGHLLEGVRRIRVVREESFHDSRTFTIGLNPADVRRPFAAFHRRTYLLIHELGHHFAEMSLTRAQRHGFAALFGDYDSPYRRLPKPRACGPDHVSRYAMTHPAEDFAETFAVFLWRFWDREGVVSLLAGRSPLCRKKEREMARAILRSVPHG
jgi:hypothetical protein